MLFPVPRVMLCVSLTQVYSSVSVSPSESVAVTVQVRVSEVVGSSLLTTRSVISGAVLDNVSWLLSVKVPPNPSKGVTKEKKERINDL